jgi:hypothetical protein
MQRAKLASVENSGGKRLGPASAERFSLEIPGFQCFAEYAGHSTLEPFPPGT